MVKTNPRKIEGAWQQGYALDQHTIKSVYIGEDEHGHPRFDTTRSEIGELLYRLKYGHDLSVVNDIADAAVSFAKDWKPKADLLIPVTPSRVRSQQPVFLVGAEIAKRLNIPFVAKLLRDEWLSLNSRMSAGTNERPF